MPRDSASPRLHVEIWSDLACPWCHIGKRRFESALARFAHAGRVRVTWRSFELDPGAPPERGGERAIHLARKYGSSLARARAMQDRMAAVAAAEGLRFAFEVVRDGNTFDAHRLLHLAAAHGRQDALAERLMRAHLGEGVLVSDHAALRRLAEEVGLPGDAVAEVLATNRYAEAVRADEHAAAALGISAVPYFAVDRRTGVAGAQPAEVLLELLERAWASRRPPLSVIHGGDTGGADGG